MSLFSSVATAEKVKPVAEAVVPWSTEEQKLLEQAMKTYPSGPADRWDNIASCIPSRNRRDVILRVKVLL